MNVAKIAAAPMLRMIGMRLPNSAQAKPPIDSRTMAIRMSEGTEPVAAKPTITAIRTRKIGSGTIPILASTIFHQPFGQNGAGAGRSGFAFGIVVVLGILSSESRRFLQLRHEPGRRQIARKQVPLP